MSGVEELAVRVAIEKEKADKAKLAELLRLVGAGYVTNNEQAEATDLASLDRYYFRGLAAAYLRVFMRAEELYGVEGVEKLLLENPPT